MLYVDFFSIVNISGEDILTSNARIVCECLMYKMNSFI